MDKFDIGGDMGGGLTRGGGGEKGCWGRGGGGG